MDQKKGWPNANRIWHRNLERLGQPLEHKVLTLTFPVNDKEISVTIQRYERAVPDAASVVDALMGRGAKSDH